jgi:maleylpyruvate isomerase
LKPARQVGQFGADEAALKSRFTHWVETTFDPLEITLAQDSRTGPFCHGDTPGLAD